MNRVRLVDGVARIPAVEFPPTPIGYEAVSTEKVGDGEEALRGAEAAEPSEITPLLRVHVKIYPFQRGVSGQFAGGYYNYWSQYLSLDFVLPRCNTYRSCRSID